jgi:hypothetical protein
LTLNKSLARGAWQHSNWLGTVPGKGISPSSGSRTTEAAINKNWKPGDIEMVKVTMMAS